MQILYCIFKKKYIYIRHTICLSKEKTSISMVNWFDLGYRESFFSLTSAIHLPSSNQFIYVLPLTHKSTTKTFPITCYPTHTWKVEGLCWVILEPYFQEYMAWLLSDGHSFFSVIAS